MLSQQEFEATPDFRLGRWGEDVVRKHVLNSGGMIMSTRDFLKQQDATDAFDDLQEDIKQQSRRGPSLEGKYHQETLTDFVAFVKGKAWWIEVKTKSRIYKWDGKRVHGVDKHHFESYGRLQEIVGAPVLLVFVCNESDAVLRATYNLLQPTAIDGGWFKNKDGKWCRMMHCDFDLLSTWVPLNGTWYPPPAQHYRQIAIPAPPLPPIPIRTDSHGQIMLF